MRERERDEFVGAEGNVLGGSKGAGMSAGVGQDGGSSSGKKVFGECRYYLSIVVLPKSFARCITFVLPSSMQVTLACHPPARSLCSVIIQTHLSSCA